MEVKAIDPNQLSENKHCLLTFINNHGDKRITLKGLRWLHNLSDQELNDEGNCILVASQEDDLIGVLAISKWGIQHSFLVIHHDYRGNGIAKILLQEMMKRVDKFYARVAYDNIPSLNTCFSIGMITKKLIKGPTGKPTFLLSWVKQDDLDNKGNASGPSSAIRKKL